MVAQRGKKSIGAHLAENDELDSKLRLLYLASAPGSSHAYAAAYAPVDY